MSGVMSESGCGAMNRPCCLLVSLVALLCLLPSMSRADFVFPTALTRYSWPLRLGGEVGLNFLERSIAGSNLYQGSSIAVEVAGDGLKFNLGTRYQAMQFLPLYGAGINASCMYLWDESDATFLGLEASVSMLMLSITGGIYRRVSGELHEDLLLTAGVGAGLP